MIVKTRPLNKGERFCCSMKAAKEMFADTDMYLDFAYLHRNYTTFARTPDAFYMKNNIKGGVVMSLYMRENYEKPILSFYVIPAKYPFSDEKQEETEQKYLPEFKILYSEMRNVERTTGATKVMLLEIHEGTLKLHKFNM